MNPSFRVAKFGGSSQATPDRVRRVVDIIRDESREGPLAVVVSAAGQTTDLLINAASRASVGDEHIAAGLVDQVHRISITNARDVLGTNGEILKVESEVEALLSNLRKLLYGVSLLREYTPQSLDLIQSFGERLSAMLMSEFLNGAGIKSIFVDARDWLVTSDEFGRAQVDWEASSTRIKSFRTSWSGLVTVHTGYLGRTPDGRTTTLGRNGSDYTATLLARGLEARDVSIWTDVSGVMTADPSIVPDAYPLERLSYMEALELATFGAKMFHPRTMIPLIESGIPLRIRNTFTRNDSGTLVDETGVQDRNRPTSVTSLENVALLDIQVRRLGARPKMAERVQRSLDTAGITVWLSTQSAHGQALSAVVPIDQADKAVLALESDFRAELESHELQPIRVELPVTLLTLVAEAMGQHTNVAGRMFAALGAVGVNVLSIGQSASSRSISCVIPAADTASGVRAVHDAFNFAHQTVNLCVLGKGTVGSQLLEQIASQQSILRDHHDIDLRLVGLAGQDRLVFDADGIDPRAWKGRMDGAHVMNMGPQGPVSIEVLEKLRRLSVPILVDATAADGMESLYHEALGRGIHVVAANKKPLTISMEGRNALLAEARDNSRFYVYETTVGASLPVIETLKDLVRTGDQVRLIEGSFSGTLGYLTNQMMSGQPLADAVREAQELGYTEPQPQDDLSGLDAARKALILARELGMSIELSDVALTPLVPENIISEANLDAFYEKLRDHQPEIDRKLSDDRASGRVLRYLARIDPSAPERGEPVMTVGPMAVPQTHPAARLRGSEAFVAFTTARYEEYPLIVQGSGAGGAVTAAGVLADVLRVAQTLRGR
ncbi:MAG: bifunctional aspartate kinase/homoserine dehydrogenase I [Myxococcota bacterium]